MLRAPEIEGIVRQNYQEVRPVFREWMQLSDVISPEARSRWDRIKQNRLPAEVQGLIDQPRAEWNGLISQARYREAIVLAHQEVSKIDPGLPVEHLMPVRSVLYRLRGWAQAGLAEHSGLFLPLNRPDLDRSMVYISAGVDVLRADVARGVITKEVEHAAEAFGFAGMPRIQYVIAQRVMGGLVHELWTRQVPRPSEIERLERKLLGGKAYDFRGLRF